jgi:hypothetical protein
MAAPSWTDEHARLVGATAPAIEAPPDAEVDRVWNLVAEVVAAPEPGRRRRKRVVLGAGVVAVVVGVSGVAAANVWSARTGEFQTDEESIRLSGPGELIDPRGADYEQVLVEEIADIPFPSQAARDLAVADQVADARREAASMEQAQADGRPDWRSVQVTGGMRAEAARAAVCAWANTWAAATKAGDASGRAKAIGTLEAAPTWPAVTDVDAEQAFTWKKMRVTDEAGTTRLETYLDNTPFAYLSLVVAAAHGHDLSAMGQPFVRWTRCIPELVPDLPAAVPPEFRAK